MKRYEFRMAKVLRVRHLQEEAARAAVASARTAERGAAVAADAARTHYADLAPAAATTSLHEFLTQRAQADLRVAGVHHADTRHHEATKAAAAAVDGWHAAHRRVDALERLDGRRRDEYAVVQRRHSDAAADEFITNRRRRSA